MYDVRWFGVPQVHSLVCIVVAVVLFPLSVDMMFPIVYSAEMPDRSAITTFARPDALKGSLVKTLGKVAGPSNTLAY